MKFKILQTKNRDLLFMHYDWISDKFNLLDYKTVYEGNIETKSEDKEEICEILFRQFNRVTKEDCERLESIGFKGHSLSVSDIIMFENDNTIYYVDAFGFTKINYKKA